MGNVCVSIVEKSGSSGLPLKWVMFSPPPPPHSLFPPPLVEKLKLDRDFSKYNYLSLDSATVNGLDDAANFRTVRVSYSVLFICKYIFHIHTQKSPP